MDAQKQKLETKLISRKRFMDYDVTGISDIHRAAVPYRIKKGDYFNIYRGDSIKQGCKWLGNLHHSLLNFVYN